MTTACFDLKRLSPEVLYTLITVSGCLQERPFVASAATTGAQYANSDINEPLGSAGLVAAVNSKPSKQQRRGAAVLHQPKRIKKA